jgi:triacylglycerol esterase/lipase EstA (alpha/beta hydrolase family)
VHRGRQVAIVAAAVLAGLLPRPVAASADGPALTVPADRLAGSLTCPTFEAGRDPVLLVHGTATDSHDSWSWNYERALPALGFSVCTVDLPERALGDIQTASEYVVHAIRAIAAASGRKVAVIGHSQGTLEPRWALRWWPDVRRLVDDDISLAGPHHGATGAEQVCTTGSCAAAAQQMRFGSHFLTALNRGDETPGDVDYTSVFSQNDELVQPPSSARLDGAVNVLVQDLCPGRSVHHGGALHDAAVFAVVLDALTHPGPADPARVDRAACLRPWMPGVDEPVTGNAMLYGPAFLALLQHDTVPAEPPLAPYAR